MQQIDWLLASSIIITGLTVVFSVLILLWIAIIILGKIIGHFSKNEKPLQPVLPSTPATPLPPSTLSDETVAVITAAASTMIQGNFTLKEITLHGQSTPIWKSDERSE